MKQTEDQKEEKVLPSSCRACQYELQKVHKYPCNICQACNKWKPREVAP